MRRCSCNCGLKYRYFILAIVWLANVSQPLTCRNMVFTIQAMVDHTYLEKVSSKDNDTNSKEVCDPSMNNSAYEMEDGPYKWNDETQARVLSIIAMGLLVGTVLALWVYDFVFLRPTFAISMLWVGLINMCIPVIAHKGNEIGVLIGRFSTGLFIGLCTPANQIICSSWFLASEQNQALTIAYSGQNLGSLLFALSGLVNETLGWKAIFYLTGGSSVVSSILIFVFYSDDPMDNIFLSKEEKKLLRPVWLGDQGAESNALRNFYQRMFIARPERRKPVPWLKTLSYYQVWALFVAYFGAAWACEATITYTQVYLIEYHKFTLGQTSMLNSLPTNLSMVIFGIVGSGIAEWAISKGCKKIHVRRIGALFVMSVAGFFLSMAFIDCELQERLIILLLICSSFRAGMFVSLQPSILDLSPTYQGTLLTFANIIGFIPGFIVPEVYGLVGKETRGQWQIVFGISAIVMVVTQSVYLLAIRSTKPLGFDPASRRTTPTPSPPKEGQPESDAVEKPEDIPTPEPITIPIDVLAFAAAWPREKNEYHSLWTIAEADIVAEVLKDVEDELRHREGRPAEATPTSPEDPVPEAGEQQEKEENPQPIRRGPRTCLSDTELNTTSQWMEDYHRQETVHLNHHNRISKELNHADDQLPLVLHHQGHTGGYRASDTNLTGQRTFSRICKNKMYGVILDSHGGFCRAKDVNPKRD